VTTARIRACAIPAAALLAGAALVWLCAERIWGGADVFMLGAVLFISGVYGLTDAIVPHDERIDE
jgi:hypothetical protein